MGLSTGTKLGPYEIVAPLGAGGMGEVYRARDTRLGREVAVKVLSGDVSGDARALARFESEARAVAALSHPNILALHDVGESNGIHYAVTELLEGETLRAVISRGAPPVRRALEISEQVAKALAAAHVNGIVHRDVKPENIFITKDGDAKLLDFGLARHSPLFSDAGDSHSPTAAILSERGAVVGTVAYMSPEQASGWPVDHRSDQFSLGTVLYEMLAGGRPFVRDSAAETLAAIIHEEPEPLERAAPGTPAPVRFLVERLLTKEPEGRYDSTRDLARDLATWKLHPSSASGEIGTAPPPPASRKRRLAAAVLVVALLGLSAVGLFRWGEIGSRAPPHSFKRITFRRGTVTSARFTPDFQSVVYSARWEGKPSEVFVQRLASADARPLGVSNAAVAGTAGGDVAILQGEQLFSWTLAKLPLEGGTPRDLLKDIDDATWDRSGSRFAIVRAVKGRQRLEYPVGKVLVETKGVERIANPRFSPDGKWIAFYSLPNGLLDTSGDVCVVDLSGQKRMLSNGWVEAGGAGATAGPGWGGLAWSPDGKEVWFSATRAGISRGLHAVTLSGRERLVTRLPGTLLLHDIAPDGRVILTFGQGRRFELRGRMAGDEAERDLSWLDGTFGPSLASDGTQMLFQEWGEGGTSESSAYHWRMGSPTPKRLGEGAPFSVSPDWTTTLVMTGLGERAEFKLVPIGAGEATTIPRGSIHTNYTAVFHPDGKRIISVGTDAAGKTHLYAQDLAGGLPRAFAQVDGPVYPWLQFSPDGRFIAANPAWGASWVLYPIDGGEPRPIPFLTGEDYPLGFGDDGKSLFLTDNLAKIPAHVLRLDLKTGKRTLWLELAPPDRAGAFGIGGPWITPNGRFYAYTCIRLLSDLYLVEGLR